jgi:asparagine synthase (glutamine-hydrolysing)
MCGIAGVVSPGQARLPGPEVVDAMLGRIVHRGPDDQGEYRNAFAHVGMRRLSIIDLGGGHQPIGNEDGRIQVVFNGEIYNYRDLRRELEGFGHRFRTASDTEVIVHGYEQWGTGCFSRMRGMFAIAIVDEVADQLVLARDRLGKKPLYHTMLEDGSVAFASELKCLFALPGFAPRVSQAATRDYFTLGYVPGPHTIYDGVWKLPPAHWRIVPRQGGPFSSRQQGRFWKPEFGPKFIRSEATLERCLAEQLDEAVRVRLVADVPFGAFLSGGLDSSVVAALMARHMSEPVKTFTIGFREDDFNELPDARAIARHIGSQHHELIVEARAVDLLDDLVWHFDEPFGDSSAIPTWLVSQLASRHVKMVLSGDGGDELFSGYERYRRFERLQRWRTRSLGLAAPAAHAAAAWLKDPTARRLSRIAARLAQPFPDSYLSGVALSTAADLRRMLHPSVAAGDPFSSVRHHFDQPDIAEPMERVLHGDMATYLTDDILVKVDRMTMAHSLEARAPLLDHQLIDFVARLPYDMKAREGRGKVLLRKVAEALLPPALLAKRKQGFAIPVAAWMRTELRELVSSTFHDRSFRERGLFDVRGVQTLLDEHLVGAHDHSESLWLMLTYELWARRTWSAPPVVTAAAA